MMNVTPTPASDGDDAPCPPKTIAEKLELLFQTTHPGKDRPYTLEEVVNSIRDRGGPTISVGFLWALRKGKSDNPTLRHMQALAGFFGVPVGYFFDDETTARIAPQLELLGLLQDFGVTHIALRAAELEPQGQA